MNEKTLLDMLTSIIQPAEAASTKVEHGHTAIDKEIDNFGGYTMSQAPERKLVGQGLGMLEFANIGVPFGDAKRMLPLLRGMKKQLDIEVLGKMSGEKMTTELLRRLMAKYASGFGSIKNVKDLDKYIGFEQYAAKRAKQFSGRKK